MSRSARQATPLAAVVAVTVSAGALLTACGAANSPDPAQPTATGNAARDRMKTANVMAATASAAATHHTGSRSALK